MADNENSDQPIVNYVVERYRAATSRPVGYGATNDPRQLHYSYVKSCYIRRLLLEAGVDSSGLVLELGVGTGLMAVPLAECGYRIVGCDLSPDMLSRAQAYKCREGLSHPLLLRGNGLHLPFAESTFSGVYAMQVFHLFPLEVRQRLADELLRVLRPNGVLVADFLQRWSHCLKYLRSRRSRPYRYGTGRDARAPFGRFSRVHLHGGVLPFVWRLAGKSRKEGARSTFGESFLGFLSDNPGLRQLTHSIMVVARK